MGMWFRALERANSRKAELKHFKATKSTYDPVELKNDKDFSDFESGSDYCFFTIPGQN